MGLGEDDAASVAEPSKPRARKVETIMQGKKQTGKECGG